MCATNIPGNERSLVIRLIAGDEDAFCELYAAYKNRLIYFAMRFLKSREYAEDIFQDAFTTIWESRRFINPNTSFSSYLYFARIDIRLHNDCCRISFGTYDKKKSCRSI